MRHRIRLSFFLLIAVTAFVIAVAYPLSIRDAVRRHAFSLIEQQQLDYVLPHFDRYFPVNSEIEFIERKEAERSVGHLIITNQLQSARGDPIPRAVFVDMVKDAYAQRKHIGHYTEIYEGATLFYVVRRVFFNGKEAFLISYMWDTYTNGWVALLWHRLLWVVFAAAIVGLSLAVWLEKYLRRPLSVLGERFSRIARRDWKHSSFVWGEDPDFERLSAQFEHMRKRLLRYDEAQKTFIRHASHELKTPVMVIESYAQSLKEGVFSADEREDACRVICEETERLKNRIRELLDYIKLESPGYEKLKIEKIDFEPFMKNIIERLKRNRPEIVVNWKGEARSISADRRLLVLVFENLLANALRHARSTVVVSTASWDNTIRFTVYNDGEPIPNNERALLFVPFYKGKGGEYGLGLSIVKRIIDLHGGEISVENRGNGVAFLLDLPKVIQS